MNLYKENPHSCVAHWDTIHFLYTMFQYAILYVRIAMLKLRFKPAFEIVAKIQSVDLISSTRLRTN